MKEKILKLLKILNEGLVDKESTMKIGLLALLAGENIVLLGPPGTAKSEVARRYPKLLIVVIILNIYWQNLLHLKSCLVHYQLKNWKMIHFQERQMDIYLK